jgi:protein-S-isoprenylcysteine O-methyltransferase Ste14
LYLFDQRIMGIIMLLLLGVMGVVNHLATGSPPSKPKGSLLAIIANTYNYFFLFIAIPAAAILLITGRQKIIDPIQLASDMSGLRIGLEIAGLIIFVLGNLLVNWAIIKLGRNFQAAVLLPRTGGWLVTDGPYRLIRHPIGLAALCISLGISCLMQSLVYFVIFIIYLVLNILVIPSEEKALRQVYGEQYVAYTQHTKKLIPFVY